MKKYIRKIPSALPYVVFILSAVILIIRAFYSFCWSDETFYLSTCHRLYTGDGIFRHEWFPTQLSSLIMLPFYALYIAITGSVEGIVVYFRILFVLMSTLNAVIVYNILKKHASVFTSMVCALFLVFYTHLNIATLSYYTFSVQFFLVSMLIIYHYYSSESKGQLILSGVIFALSVLSLPTLSIAYFLLLAGAGIVFMLEKKQKLSDRTVNMVAKARLYEVIRYTFAGIVIPATVFIIYLLLTVPVTDFIKAIPYVLSDEEHGTTLIYPIKKFFIGINEVFGYGAYAAYLLILSSALISYFKKGGNRILRLLIFVADAALFVRLYIVSVGHTGYIQTVLCLFALPLFFLQEKKDLRLFFTLIVSGMIFSLVYSYSSNGYLYVLSMGHFISSIGCIIILEQFAKESLGKRENTGKTGRSITGYLYLICCTAIICISLTQTMMLRLVNIYRDAPVQMLDFRIAEGPAKGLYTTPDHYLSYNVAYATIHKYCQSGNTPDGSGNIFITSLLPWGYMCTDLRCGAPTTWRTAFNSERLKPYYEMNPDKIPDIILVMDETYGSYITSGDVVSDPTPNINEIGGWLLDYVEDRGYEKLDVPCGVLYRKK
ncbi:MAG: hypothetical protein IJT37_03325 [Lachnospiraceae bacterium]|nr:hypothetical protein [Lachnospiraceae bacterium]